MSDKMKPLMDELALVFLKIVETAVFDAITSGEVKQTEATKGEPKNAEVVETTEKQKNSRRVFPKPCPECGVENVRRRYSYLCEAHTTEEFLAKHRGWTNGWVVKKPKTAPEAEVAG
jgi:hypothetical protein